MNETFFLEITVMIELKLYMNGHWVVPYKVGIFLCGLDIQDGHHCKT